MRIILLTIGTRNTAVKCVNEGVDKLASIGVSLAAILIYFITKV